MSMKKTVRTSRSLNTSTVLKGLVPTTPAQTALIKRLSYAAPPPSPIKGVSRVMLKRKTRKIFKWFRIVKIWAKSKAKLPHNYVLRVLYLQAKAMKIQRFYRRYKLLKRFQSLIPSVLQQKRDEERLPMIIKIQQFFRKNIYRKKYQRIAIKIQSMWRGYICRVNMVSKVMKNPFNLMLKDRKYYNRIINSKPKIIKKYKKYTKAIYSDNHDLSVKIKEMKLIHHDFRLIGEVKKQTKMAEKRKIERMEITHPRFAFYRLDENEIFSNYAEEVIQLRNDSEMMKNVVNDKNERKKLLLESEYGKYKIVIPKVLIVQRFIKRLYMNKKNKYIKSINTIAKCYKLYKLKYYLKNMKRIISAKIIQKYYHKRYFLKHLKEFYQRTLVGLIIYKKIIIPNRIKKIILIQKNYRRHYYSKMMKKKIACRKIVNIMRYIKKHKVYHRKYMKIQLIKRKLAEQLIKKEVLKYINKTKNKRLEKKKNKSIIKIQKIFRGYICRKKVVIPIVFRLPKYSVFKNNCIYYNNLINSSTTTNDNYSSTVLRELKKEVKREQYKKCKTIAKDQYTPVTHFPVPKKFIKAEDKITRLHAKNSWLDYRGNNDFDSIYPYLVESVFISDDKEIMKLEEKLNDGRLMIYE